MTNQKYRVVIMLNCLERCLRNLKAAQASVADMERILLPEATAILRVTAKADLPYVRNRLGYMLDQGGFSAAMLDSNPPSRSYTAPAAQATGAAQPMALGLA